MGKDVTALIELEVVTSTVLSMPSSRNSETTTPITNNRAIAKTAWVVGLLPNLLFALIERTRLVTLIGLICELTGDACIGSAGVIVPSIEIVGRPDCEVNNTVLHLVQSRRPNALSNEQFGQITLSRLLSN